MHLIGEKKCDDKQDQNSFGSRQLIGEVMDLVKKQFKNLKKTYINKG